MSRNTTTPAGNGGHRTTISRLNSTPTPIAPLLAQIAAAIPPPCTQEAQEAQEVQENQERQDTYGVPSQREGESCVSCVYSSEGEEDSYTSGNPDDSYISCVQEEGAEGDRSCVSCVQQEGGVPESDFQRCLRQAAERSTKEVLKYRGSPLRADYRSPALLFARCLKARPELAGLDAEAVTERIDAELDLMFPNHPAPWVALGLLDEDSRNEACDPRSDFLVLWGTVTTPFEPGGRVQEAARQAEEKPLDFGGRFSRPADDSYRMLLSLCYWLGADTEGEFFLSCRNAGEVLEVSPTTASKLLHRAEANGFLVPVGTYTEKDRAGRHAKTWRFKPPDPLQFLD